jgi:hypothetical protein
MICCADEGIPRTAGDLKHCASPFLLDSLI